MANRLTWILAVAAVALVGLAAWFLWPSSEAPGTNTGPSGAMTVTDGGAGGVTVKATRENGSTPQRATFLVALDTHTVELTDYDIVANSRLEDSTGKRISPLPGSTELVPGSHHKEARLLFDGPGSGQVVLVLKNLGGAPERRLVFDA